MIYEVHVEMVGCQLKRLDTDYGTACGYYPHTGASDVPERIYFDSQYVKDQ